MKKGVISRGLLIGIVIAVIILILIILFTSPKIKDFFTTGQDEDTEEGLSGELATASPGATGTTSCTTNSDCNDGKDGTFCYKGECIAYPYYPCEVGGDPCGPLALGKQRGICQNGVCRLSCKKSAQYSSSTAYWTYDGDKTCLMADTSTKLGKLADERCGPEIEVFSGDDCSFANKRTGAVCVNRYFNGTGYSGLNIYTSQGLLDAKYWNPGGSGCDNLVVKTFNDDSYEYPFAFCKYQFYPFPTGDGGECLMNNRYQELVLGCSDASSVGKFECIKTSSTIYTSAKCSDEGKTGCCVGKTGSQLKDGGGECFNADEQICCGFDSNCGSSVCNKDCQECFTGGAKYCKKSDKKITLGLEKDSSGVYDFTMGYRILNPIRFFGKVRARDIKVECSFPGQECLIEKDGNWASKQYFESVGKSRTIGIRFKGNAPTTATLKISVIKPGDPGVEPIVSNVEFIIKSLNIGECVDKCGNGNPIKCNDNPLSFCKNGKCEKACESNQDCVNKHGEGYICNQYKECVQGCELENEEVGKKCGEKGCCKYSCCEPPGDEVSGAINQIEPADCCLPTESCGVYIHNQNKPMIHVEKPFCRAESCGEDKKVCGAKMNGEEGKGMNRCCPKDAECIIHPIKPRILGFPELKVELALCGQKEKCDESKGQESCGKGLRPSSGQGGAYQCCDQSEEAKATGTATKCWTSNTKWPAPSFSICGADCNTAEDESCCEGRTGTNFQGLKRRCKKGEQCKNSEEESPSGKPICLPTKISNPSNPTQNSVYIIHEKTDLFGYDEAYIIKPEIEFSVPITVTMNYSIFGEYETYKYEDIQEVLDSCNSTLVSTASKQIGSNGGEIEARRIHLDIPNGAVNENINFIIEEYELRDCSGSDSDLIDDIEDALSFTFFPKVNLNLLFPLNTTLSTNVTKDEFFEVGLELECKKLDCGNLEVGLYYVDDLNVTFSEEKIPFNIETTTKQVDSCISSCQFLYKPGVYTLCNDISAPGGKTCFTIGSDNIELNLNGYKIIGSKKYLRSGVYVSDKESFNNLTIRNGEIIDFWTGIDARGEHNNGTFKNLIISSNHDGRDHRVTKSFYGMIIQGKNNLIENVNISTNNAHNILERHKGTGIAIGKGYNKICYNDILRNIIVNNNHIGITIDCSNISSKNIYAKSNDIGIVLLGSSTILNNFIAYHNKDYDFYCAKRSNSGRHYPWHGTAFLEAAGCYGGFPILGINYTEFSGLIKLRPINSTAGTAPLYTGVNPIIIENMTSNQTINLRFLVNASGEIDSSHQLIAYVKSLEFAEINDKTHIFEVKINEIQDLQASTPSSSGSGGGKGTTIVSTPASDEIVKINQENIATAGSPEQAADKIVSDIEETPTEQNFIQKFIKALKRFFENIFT